MTPADRLYTLAPDDSLSRASELIATNDVNQLPVIDEGHVLGFVTRAGIMRMVQLRGQTADVTEKAESGAPEAQSSRNRGLRYATRTWRRRTHLGRKTQSHRYKRPSQGWTNRDYI